MAKTPCATLPRLPGATHFMSRSKVSKLVVLLIGAAMALTLILQNLQTETVYFLFARVSMPRAGLLLSTLLIGFVLGLLTPGLLRLRK